jgi:hypothetical protein
LWIVRVQAFDLILQRRPLRQLLLSHCASSDLAAVAAAPALRGLQFLRMRFKQTPPPPADVVAALASLTQLEELALEMLTRRWDKLGQDTSTAAVGELGSAGAAASADDSMESKASEAKRKPKIVLPLLARLTLESCDGSLAELFALPSLRLLALTGAGVKLSAVAPLLAARPPLQYLWLDMLPWLRDGDLAQAVLSVRGSLQLVVVSDCECVTQAFARSLAREDLAPPWLHKLWLAGSWYDETNSDDGEAGCVKRDPDLPVLLARAYPRLLVRIQPAFPCPSS